MIFEEKNKNFFRKTVGIVKINSYIWFVNDW
jgi:hypothetical protein